MPAFWIGGHIMRNLLLLSSLILGFSGVVAQEAADSSSVTSERKVAEDPTQFLSRIEVFNEYQHYNNGINLNITTFRAVIKFGKRFTTRMDIPYGYNSKNTADYKQNGLSDISFRLLGFRLYQSRKDAISLSLEASLNTAQSPLLGTGKNMLILMGTYTRVLVPRRMLLAGAIQQANSVSGDQTRTTIAFSKLQVFLLNFWSKKTWTVVAPECFIDFVKGGASMNLEGRFAYAPIPKVNLWLKGGLGLFGDFIARYQWSTEFGFRLFI